MRPAPTGSATRSTGPPRTSLASASVSSTQASGAAPSPTWGVARGAPVAAVEPVGPVWGVAPVIAPVEPVGSPVADGGVSEPDDEQATRTIAVPNAATSARMRGTEPT